MGSIKRRIKEIVIQIIPVMIGVYLGFVVNDWAQSSRDKEARDKLRANLISEIESNQAWIDRVASYHVMLRDSTRYYSDGEHFLDDYPAFFQGLILEPLQSSAFETGVQTGLINELPLDVIQDLNRLYTTQKFYNDFSQIALQGMLVQDNTKTREGLTERARFIALIMSDVIIREKYLQDLYPELKEQLEAL